MVQIKKDKFLNIIGLMSGTSLDGIDISLVKSNGVELQTLNNNYYFKYKKSVSIIFEKILINYKTILKDKNLKNKVDNFVTKLHVKAILKSGFLSKADIIGFHGQTMFHDPGVKSIQLGNPNLLAKLLKKTVIFDFRKIDINNKGQGAPLAPIYHKTIIQKNNLELPSCFLNIGGISNISYWDGKSLIGFDTGPGNNLMDAYIMLHSKHKFDPDGYFASKGKINDFLLKNFMKNKYFKKNYPKSLDKNYFKKEFNFIKKLDLNLNDVLSTLAEITIISIINSFNLLPKYPKSILVSGGGYKNKNLINNLKKRAGISFFDLKDFKLDPDFIESELIAFLTARRFYNLPITFPETTGVSKPSIGGNIYNNL